MSERKMVRRSVAIALGIICIVLIGSFAGTLVVLNIANQQNASLQSQLNDFNDIVNLNRSITILENESVEILGNTVSASSSTYNRVFIADYSGVVKVDVEPADPNLWVEVWYDYSINRRYDYPDFRYIERRAVGCPLCAPDNTWYYPITASPWANTYDNGWVTIYVGNNSTNTITAKITITYYY